MRPIDWRWAILLCRFSDRPSVPQPPDYYEDLYTRNGAGGVVDYWREVTFGGLDLTGSRVFGWLTMSHGIGDVSQLVFPGQRGTLVQWGRDAAAAAGIDLSPFRSVLVVQNYGVDHGAAGNGVVIVHSNPALCEFGFICHEMGHSFGLPHSFATNPDFEYGDSWDLMSFATTTTQFSISFRGSTGEATVGLNSRNLEALGVLEPSRRWTAPGPDFSSTVTLDPLNQPPVGSHGSLVAHIPPGATIPARADGSTWTVEYHHKAVWDQAIAEDLVTIHQIRANGLSYLQPALFARFTTGQQLATPAPEVYIKITGISASPPTATIRLWDLPEGCLRKEDSKPKVYLIANGAKRWVTSPAVLVALGRSWADVRSVPDGALTAVPDGPDVVIMTVAVSPRPVPTGHPIQVTVTATDTGSGAAVNGRVLVNGVDAGPTNTPFQHTFQVRRRRVPGSHPPEWEVTYPVVVVRAPGYPDADVDCGFPDV